MAILAGGAMRVVDPKKRSATKYAAEQGLAEAEALESGMQAVTQRHRARPGFPKRREFLEKGAELYAKA